MLIVELILLMNIDSKLKLLIEIIFLNIKIKKIANEWGDKINYFISKCAEKKNK